jgi:hypothetical protein
VEAIKEMRDKTATGDDAVPVDVLKLWGEENLSLTTLLINNKHETRERWKDFMKVTMTALKKKPKATR